MKTKKRGTQKSKQFNLNTFVYSNFKQAIKDLKLIKSYLIFSSILFLIITLFGIMFPIFFKEEIIKLLKQIIAQTEGLNAFELTRFIMVNNIKSAFLALIFARSEGAIIGALAGIIFIGLMHRQSRKIVVSVLLVGVLLFVVVAPINNYIISKVFFNDLSGQLRINIWQGAISLLKTSPVIGVGLSGYQTLIPDFQARYYHPDTNELISVETHPYPHNLFLSLWSEIGLLGWLLFIFIIIMFWHNAWQCIKKQEIYALSVMGAMLVVLVHGLVDTPYFKNDLAVLFWFLIALVIFLKQSLNTEH